MIKKIIIIFLVILLFLTLNYSTTSLASYTTNINFGLIAIFSIVFLVFLIFSKKKEKILEKAGIKEHVERDKIIQKYSLANYLDDLRKNMGYLSKLYGDIRKKVDEIGHLESDYVKQLEERMKTVEEILDSLYNAIKNIKKGEYYNSVTNVEYAFGLSEDLSYSELTNSLKTLAGKMREAYTLRSIKLKELEKK